MKIIRESNDVTLDEVAKGYGTEVAKALVKYCNEMHTTPDEVLNDMTEDDRGMTKWDKFDNWAKRKLGIDVMGNFDDETDWTDAEDDRKRAIDESSGMTDQEILDWIGQEVSEAEWCSDLTFDDYDATLEVETMDGDRFEIKVNPLEGGTKEDVMLEGNKFKKASQLLVLFSRYEEELGNHEFNLCEKTYNEFVDLVESLNLPEDVEIELRELFDINAASPHNHKISDRFTKLVLSLGKSNHK